MGSTLAAGQAAQVEREYVACRRDVLAMLQSRFGGSVGDPEELYQEAWTEALERRAAGVQIESLRDYVKVIAWRRARDVLRASRAMPVDPRAAVLGEILDASPGPEETAEVRVAASVVRHVVDQLGPRQQAVIKLRFDFGLSGREIREVLGLTPKAMDKLVTRTYAAVEERLTAGTDGESPWTRQQRSLLVACVFGLASQAQMARARRLLADDPRARAMLRQIRATMDQATLALPVPVFADHQREPGLAVLDRLSHALASLRHGVAADPNSASWSASTAEPAAGGIAALGAAGAAKVALSCLAVAGGAVFCLQAGVLPQARHTHKRPHVAAHRHGRRVSLALVSSHPERPPVVRPVRTVARVAHVRRVRATVVHATGSAAPSPAPAGSQEFGTGGSPSSTAQPAAAPSDGGGEFTP